MELELHLHQPCRGGVQASYNEDGPAVPGTWYQIRA